VPFSSVTQQIAYKQFKICGGFTNRALAQRMIDCAL